MANSNYFDTVNNVLRSARQLTIADAATFADITQLSSTQDAAKFFVDLANRLCVRRMNDRFMQREFSFNTAADTAEYDIANAGLSSEGLVYESFYCTTDGADRPLALRSYDELRRSTPDFADIPTGRPQVLYLMPIQSDDTNITHKLRLYPTPDAIYEIRYRGKLNAVPLVNAGDIIQWPVEYEDVLWMYGKAFLVDELGTRDPSNAQALALQAIDSVKAWSIRATEEPRFQRFRGMGFDSSGRSKRGRYDFDGRAGW